MKREFIKGLIVGVAIVLMIGWTTGQARYRHGTAAVDTDGTITITTVDSYDCFFQNPDATDSINVTFTPSAGSTWVVRLYPGAVYNTAAGEIPLFVHQFATAPVANTPDIQWACNTE